MNDDLCELDWIGDAKRKLRAFPAPVKDIMGYALFLAQIGDKHPNAKPLRHVGSGVLEIVDNHDGDTYRAIYTVRFEQRVYVLHAFQKKSKKGIATPMKELNLIKQRLRDAETRYKQLAKDR